ncbi:MAG: metallophosphoesterase family protein [Microscillaceae bacterium]|nr:metallophosphoesterase family protein [Microscillaceae bacterium]
MNIIICSDIHDHIPNLKTMLDQLPEAEELICCGDLCSPFVLGLIARNFLGKIHLVFGNNDGDLFRISQTAAKFDHVFLHGEVMEIEKEGKKILANHFPEISRPIAESGKYDLVCYGHNHTFQIEQLSATWYVNPGTVMGYTPGTDQFIQATFALYDTQSHQIQAFEIVEQEVRPLLSIF